MLRFQIHDQLAKGALHFNVFSDAALHGQIEYVNGRSLYSGGFYTCLYRDLGELEFKVVKRERNVDQDFIILEKEPTLVKTESTDYFIGGGILDKSQKLQI